MGGVPTQVPFSEVDSFIEGTYSTEKYTKKHEGR